jgi:hypothetical protein
VQRPINDDSVDWETVEIRRLENNLLHNGEFSTGNYFSARHRALVDALTKYRKKQFEAAIDAWPRASRESMGDIERLALAHCYAEIGSDECLELLDPVAERFPAEAAAVRMIYYQKLHKSDEAVAAMEELCAAMRETGWTAFDGVRSALDYSVELAENDKEVGKRIFELLEQPFLVYRHDQTRQVARLSIAQTLGPKYVVQALAPMEPNIPWLEDVLVSRAEAYAAEGHPLARRAEKDLVWYRDHAPPGPAIKAASTGL